MSKILNKIQSMPAPAKASICFAFCAMLQKGILFLTTPIFTRLLSPDQYGLFSLYSSWLSIVTVICTLNLNYNVFFRGLIEFPEDKDSYTSSMQGITTFLTLIIFSTYLIRPDIWISITGLSGELIFCMFLEMLLAPAYYFWLSKQRAEYKYVAVSVITVLSLLLSTGLAVIAVMLTDCGVLARVYPVVLIDVCIGAFFYLLNLMRGRSLFTGKFWKYALAFNFPLLPHYLSDVILNQVDRVMIGDICGVSYTAIYSVAYAVAMLVSLFNSSVNASLIPWTYEKLKSDNSESEREIKSIGSVLSFAVAALSCITIAIGPELVGVLGPEEYQEAAWIMPPVGISALLMFYVYLFVNVETYYGKNRYVAYVSCAAAFLNVVLNAALLPSFGFVAASWATLACYCFMTFGHYYFMRKVRNKASHSASVFNDRLLIAIAAGTMAFGLFMLFVYTHPLVRYTALIAVVLAVYANRSKLLAAYRQIK